MFSKTLVSFAGAILLAANMSGRVEAQTAPAASAVAPAAIADTANVSKKTGKPLTTGQRYMRECGAEWKARDDKAERKGRDAWQSFRSDCMKRKAAAAKATAA